MWNVAGSGRGATIENWILEVIQKSQGVVRFINFDLVIEMNLEHLVLRFQWPEVIDWTN